MADIEELLGSDPGRADSEAAKLLVELPGQPTALLYQGISRRINGAPLAAIEVLQPLCNAWPEAPMPHLQLGLALRECGDKEAAVLSIRQAAAANEEFGDAWLALADVLHETGDSGEADKAYGMYVQHAGRDPRLQKPVAALNENRLAEAETMLRGHLQHYPTDIVAMCMLADVAERHDLLRDADRLLTQCLELAPGYVRARHNRAVVLLRQNRAPEARSECRRLLLTDPKNPEFRKLLAAILVRLREYDESIQVCEELLRERPDQPTVWTSLGHMLKSVGRRDDCVDAYRKAIVQAPRFGEPYWSLVNLKNFKMTDYELTAMQAQLDVDDLGNADRVHLHFALGRTLEQRNEAAEAFAHYEAGNRLRLADNPYNSEELSDHVRRSKALFTAAFFAARKASGANATDPIFIVGLPRSGSTLVEQILASHSMVEGTMELPDIAAIAKSLNEWKLDDGGPTYPEILATIGRDECNELGLSYIKQTRIQRKLDTPVFIDKMPNNFAHIGLIHLILPNARIIDVRRHPMACGMSLFKEHFAHAQNFSYSLDNIGWYYKTYVDLMRHFDRVLPGRVHRVIYESLVEDTETQVRQLLDYCGLEFEESCLDFHQNRRPVSTASSEQVRAPINREGLNQWRMFESWLEPLRQHVDALLETYPDVPHSH